jgi:hypothetical protein
VNDELEKMWKEEVKAYFLILPSWNLPGTTEESRIKPKSG